jgi:predicted nucleotidyltransferase
MNRAKSQEKSVAMKRASTRQWVLKPQDLAIALKLVVMKGQWLSYAQLGTVMELSQFEAHAAVQRLIAARLVVVLEGPPEPVVSALRQFVIYGAPYVYPAVRGEMTIGFPTAHGAPPLKDMVMSSNEPVPVWPHPKGKVRGMGLLPLYEKLPIAAMEDENLYALLALFDALRAGQARERELAITLLQEKLSDPMNQSDNTVMRENDDISITDELSISRIAMMSLIQRYHIKRLMLFGSAARNELTPSSDIDLLVEFEKGEAPSLGGMVAINEAFTSLFGGRKVDIATSSILNNPYRRRAIVKEMEELYAA